MYNLKLIIFINLILIFFSKIVFAEQLIKFANIDLIIKNTDIGNKALLKIDQADKSNVKS